MYSVAVTGDNGCVTLDSVYVIYDLPDIALTAITAPVTSCPIPDENVVAIELRNNGYISISNENSIIVSYAVNTGAPVTETVPMASPLLPGATIYYCI